MVRAHTDHIPLQETPRFWRVSPQTSIGPNEKMEVCPTILGDVGGLFVVKSGESRKEPPAKMMDVLDGLADYAVKHFSFEEGCMEPCACSAASVNKLAHQRFVRLVRLRDPGLQDQAALGRCLRVAPPRDR